jgi:hypothetical protein
MSSEGDGRDENAEGEGAFIPATIAFGGCLV